MSELPSHVLRLGDLPSRHPTRITLEPDAAARDALAAALGISALKKLRFAVTLSPLGRRDWTLEGALGATVVQPCVVTLAPVSTRIEEAVTRRYLSDFDNPEGGTETEMPEDESAEPLPASLDLYAVALEALALALPAWPRAEDAPPAEAQAAPPGIAPMTDDEARPFAGLAALRDRLAGDDDAQ